MSINIIEGSIFTSKCKTLVNTVNCVGVMGAGIALEYRLRYPDMYKKYVEICVKNQLSVGNLWLYKSDAKWILNFPTKKHWRYPSKKEYLNNGLKKFLETYESKGITTIAFPLLGTDKGGIDQDESLQIMKSHLNHISIDIEIYKRDRNAKDDLYDKIRDWLIKENIEEISKITKLRKDYITIVIKEMKSPDSSIVQLNQLAHIKGIGIKTLEVLFQTAQQLLKYEANGSERAK
ncbi:MAG: macro domain-containing protein [Candidatus Competibacteraceae bacterium]